MAFPGGEHGQMVELHPGRGQDRRAKRHPGHTLSMGQARDFLPGRWATKRADRCPKLGLC
jgi:hypothetical protein